MIPPIYIINLERSTHRRHSMLKRMHELDIPFELVSGVDGRDLDPDSVAAYDPQKRNWYYGHDLSPYEIGCYLSHFRLFEKIALEKPPYAVILEDDVIIDDAFPDVISALATLPPRWDLIRLAGLRQRKSRALCDLTPQHVVARLLNTATGLQGYALTPRGADKILSHATPIIRPIDIMLDRYWHNGLDILAVQPYVVHARHDIPSDTYRPAPDIRRRSDRVRVKICRFTRKLKDTLLKRLTNQWRRAQGI